MGKLLNACSDLSVGSLQDPEVVKQVTGDDFVRAEKKGADAVKFHPIAKHVFSMNELPCVTGERSNGYFRRMLVLPMNNIPERPDPRLKDRLQEEIPYFLHLLVAAGERFYERGEIFESRNSQKAVRMSRVSSDTVEAWLQDSRITRGAKKMERGKLYTMYASFCGKEDRRSLTRNAFYKALRTKRFDERREGSGRFFLIHEGEDSFIPMDDTDNFPFS